MVILASLTEGYTVGSRKEVYQRRYHDPMIIILLNSRYLYRMDTEDAAHLDTMGGGQLVWIEIGSIRIVWY